MRHSQLNKERPYGPLSLSHPHVKDTLVVNVRYMTNSIGTPMCQTFSEDTEMRRIGK